MTKTREDILKERAQLQSQFGDLFSDVEKILFRHDPMDIAYVDHENVADNPDEYSPEVDTILPRLSSATSPEDVTDIVHEEFLTWFGAESVQSKASYEALSLEIWQAWQRFKNTQGD